MQVRSKIAVGTVFLLLGLMYFGRLLPDGTAGGDGLHPHENVECRNCHSLENSEAEKGATHPKTQSCLFCHSPADDVNSPFHGSRVDSDCARCHSFHKPELVMAAQDTMQLEFAVKGGILCRDCHKVDGLEPEVGLGHRQAARLIHSQQSIEMAEAPSKFCLACHGSDQTTAIGNDISRSAPRFHVSASHVFGQTLVPGASQPGGAFRIQNEIPTHLSVINGKIECQTCHSMISDNDYLLSQTIEDGLCGSCHIRNGSDQSTLEFSLKP